MTGLAVRVEVETARAVAAGVMIRPRCFSLGTAQTGALTVCDAAAARDARLGGTPHLFQEFPPGTRFSIVRRVARPVGVVFARAVTIGRARGTP